MSESPLVLSPEGRKRREEILARALRYARRRRRARRLVGLGALAATLVILAVVFVRFDPDRQSLGPPLVSPRPPAPLAPSSAPGEGGIVITYIRTDPDILRRLAIPTQRPTWRLLNDEQLLTELSDAGRPALLARIDGRAVLILRDELPE